jgi:hypothetical protein
MIKINPVRYFSLVLSSKEWVKNSSPFHTDMKHKKIEECSIKGRKKFSVKVALIMVEKLITEKYIQNLGILLFQKL